jgi:hypothetical protein
MVGDTTIVIWLEKAGFPEAQTRLEVIWQIITSPFKGIYEYV